MIRFTEDVIDKYIGLIIYCIRKHTKIPSVSHFDMLQSGYIGLSKACKSYKKNKKGACPFKYYAYRFINSEIIKARYHNNKEILDRSTPTNIIQDLLEKDTDNQLNNQEINPPYQEIQEEEDNIENNSKIKYIYKILNYNIPTLQKNNKINKHIYLDKFINNMSTQEIADKYKLTYSAVSHRINNITTLIKTIIRSEKVYE